MLVTQFCNSMNHKNFSKISINDKLFLERVCKFCISSQLGNTQRARYILTNFYKFNKSIKLDPKLVMSVVNATDKKMILKRNGEQIQLNILKTLGTPGKEGTTYKVEILSSSDQYAMKVFKKKKSSAKISLEALTQDFAASYDLSPKIYGIVLEQCLPKPSGGKIIMELMDGLLEELLNKQDGILTEEQQYDLIRLSIEMDNIGIYHNDPNPLNIMYKNGKFYYIDFGMSLPIDIKKHGRFPNTRALGTVFFGGVQGLVNRKISKGDINIIKKYVEMAKYNPDQLLDNIEPLVKISY